MATTSTLPSLYRGDYYTPDEYAQLKNLILQDHTLRYTLLFNALENDDPKKIKRSIKDIELPYKYSLWKIIYDTPLEDIPRHINDEDIMYICQWRLQINK
jgi:hypothetical protein